MPFSIDLTEQEKAYPVNSYEALGTIMRSVLNREISMFALPPLKERTLPVREANARTKKLRPVIRTHGGNLLATEVEFFWTVGLTADLMIEFLDLVSIGSKTSGVVGAPEAFRGFAYYAAVQAVFVHNHPSGALTPSKSDEKLTKKLIKAGRLLDVRVNDHIILDKNDGIFSMLSHGNFDELRKEAALEELEVADLSKLLRIKEAMIEEKERQLKENEQRIKTMARELKASGYPPAKIGELTGLSAAEIKKL
jgi:hypothetical protein